MYLTTDFETVMMNAEIEYNDVYYKILVSCIWMK